MAEASLVEALEALEGARLRLLGSILTVLLPSLQYAELCLELLVCLQTQWLVQHQRWGLQLG